MTSHSYVPMVGVLPPGSLGVAQIDHFVVDRCASELSHIRYGQGVDPGKYARLRVNGQLMMTDTQMEQRTNRYFVRRAVGDVLIGGLGIGMVVLPVCRSEQVLTVTVVEKYQDVIDLVEPYLRKALRDCSAKLRIICAAVSQWKPDKGERFDCIYFDIWPEICTDNLPEMAALHQRFKGRLKGPRFLDSWCRDELKSRRRSERRYGRYW